MGYRNYANSVGFIVDKNGLGDFTTIAAALAASTSGTTIFIRPGTYTENLTLVSGVNLCAFSCDSITPNVLIIGKCTFSGTGAVTLSGLSLQTNSDFLLVVSGSGAVSVQLINCFIGIINNTGISYTNSNANSDLGFVYCLGNVTTTGIAIYSMSSVGDLAFAHCNFNNTGHSTTAASSSAGIVDIEHTSFAFPIVTTGTGNIGIRNCIVDTGAANVTSVTVGGSGGGAFSHSYFASGTASTISIGATCQIAQCIVNSSNTNAITGAGTLNAGIITFAGSSTTINTVTVNSLTTKGGTIV